jgi:predicted dinucleotide-binding enzyme
MLIAILGTGRFASDFAPGLVRVGHSVVYGSRRPRDEPGYLGSVVTPEEAIDRSDLIVNAMPGAAAVEVLPTHRTILAGKTLIDVSNAFDEQGGLKFPNSSVGEQLQNLLPEVRVVKTLSTMAGYVAANPALLGAPTTVFLSGDDPSAKVQVGLLLQDLGWAAHQQIDLGEINSARSVEHLGLLFWNLVLKFGTGEFNYQVVPAAGAY